jgi:two-component system osmolarity sensor histidine kinase EnvZ
VLDRGPGIPEAEREAVFRPFYRLEQSRSRQTGGSGLGLAVARQLAMANDIEIRLGPRQGGGTVASVHLPPAGGHQGVNPAVESG